MRKKPYAIYLVVYIYSTNRIKEFLIGTYSDYITALEDFEIMNNSAMAVYLAEIDGDIIATSYQYLNQYKAIR